MLARQFNKNEMGGGKRRIAVTNHTGKARPTHKPRPRSFDAGELWQSGGEEKAWREARGNASKDCNAEATHPKYLSNIFAGTFWVFSVHIPGPCLIQRGAWFAWG
jgi:hypothetical protein